MRALRVVALAAMLLAVPVAAHAQSCDIPAGYDASERPDAAGTATSLQAGVFIIDVTSVSDADQRVTMDLVVSLTWKDPRLAGLAGCNFDVAAIWEPRVLLVNRRSLTLTQPNRFSIAEGGVVSYFQRGYGDFSVPLDLRDFPFDRQRVEIRALSRTYGPDELHFEPRSTSGRSESFIASGWRFGELTSSSVVATPAGQELAGITFGLAAERDHRYYVWRLIVPLTIVVAMAWLAQWIEPGLAPARIGMSSTAVLTVFAYQFSIANVLPRLSYITRMDVFFIGATVIVFLGLLLAVLVVELNRRGHAKAASSTLRAARLGIPLLYLGAVAYAFLG